MNHLNSLLLIFLSLPGMAQWNLDIKITADSAEQEGFFGHDIELMGEYAFIASARQTVRASQLIKDAGSVHIYRKQEASWNRSQILYAPEIDSFRYFGLWLEASGEYLSLLYYDLNGDSVLMPESKSREVLLIYKIRNDTWSFHQKIDLGAYTFLAENSLAMSDSNIVVGLAHVSHIDGSDTLPFAGTAHVIELNDSGLWEKTISLKAPVPGAYDAFGNAAAVDGNTIVIAAYLENENENEINPLLDAGSVYIYQRETGQWKYVQKLVAADRNTNDLFGASLALDSNILVIGAFGEDYNEADQDYKSFSGAIYLYKSVNGIWQHSQKIVAKDRSIDAYFGYTVSIEGTEIAVGAYNALTGDGMHNQPKTGAVYTFDYNGQYWTQQSKIVPPLTRNQLYMGRMVCLHGNHIGIALPYDPSDTNWNVIAYRAGSALIYSRDSLLTGIEFISTQEITLKPNPNPGTFQISFERAPKGTILIMDQQGRKVYSETFNETNQLNISNSLIPGIYHLQIRTECGILLKKFVVV